MAEDTQTQEERQVREDIWIVALKKTGDYAIEEDDKPDIEDIFEVYLFDRSCHVHCCELTPSYFLVYLYTTMQFSKLVMESDDPGTDQRRDELQSKYTDEGSNDCYIHVWDMERLIESLQKSGEPFRLKHVGQVDHWDDIDGDTYAEKIDTVAQSYRENCPL